MSRSILPAIAAALLMLVAPSGVRAQDNGGAVFSVFRDACIAGGADAAYALNKLRGQGWVEAPEVIAEPMRQQTGRDAVVLLNFDIDTAAMKAAPELGPAMVMVGTAPPEAFGVPLSGPFCGLVPFETDERAVRAALMDHYRFAPVEEEGMTLWMFSRARGGAVIPIADMDALLDEAYLQRMRETPHYIAGVARDVDLTIILFMRLVP